MASRGSYIGIVDMIIKADRYYSSLPAADVSSLCLTSRSCADDAAHVTSLAVINDANNRDLSTSMIF